ncbi:MAG: N-acetylglucosamine-6-phosphate deacetylase, partial [Candidatus Nephrothrix sp. EaCA]
SDAYASIIADGIHVDYQTLSISKKLMGERLFLISDAVEEALEGAYVHVRRADCFTLPDGTLSGSQLTLLKAVKNCVQKADVPLREALNMASLYPARVMRETHIGVIEKGAKANLILFDEDLRLKEVYLEGVSVNHALS